MVPWLFKEARCIESIFLSSIEEILYETKGIKMNIDGVNAGILSDLGFDWKVGTGIWL